MSYHMPHIAMTGSWPHPSNLFVSLFLRGAQAAQTIPISLSHLISEAYKAHTYEPYQTSLLTTLFLRRTPMNPIKLSLRPTFFQKHTSHTDNNPLIHIFVPLYFRGAQGARLWTLWSHLFVSLYYRGAQGAHLWTPSAISLSHFISEGHKPYRQ